MGLYLQWQRVKIGLARVAELREFRPALPMAPAGEMADLPTGDIVAERVTFTYPGSEREAITDVSFTIPAGSKAWFRGDSGSGKSTFIDLLHRHFAPSQGSIRVGDVDVRNLDPGVLRRQVVVVSQEAVLFAASLRDNIRYGQPEASPEAIEQAAQAAGVLEFAARLPDGLDALVGPRGATLSGGERQRVALARALLMAPSVLVVDEGTSSLDDALEQRTLQAIDGLLPQATRIVVSHRPLDVADFDLVIGFPQGGIR
jgi:ATP-binding cassette subfamily B protein